VRHAAHKLLAIALAATLLANVTVFAHSASDAYLTVVAEPRAAGTGPARSVLHGQWDIALRDLDFVLGLDDDGDGNIVSRELRRHQPQIERYAFEHLSVHADGGACAVRPTRQLVTDHADGAYAALFFDIVCNGDPAKLMLDYRLFFSIDPSHRAIVVLHRGAEIATALLSPEHAQLDLKK
jgi:hypothetical protein